MLTNNIYMKLYSLIIIFIIASFVAHSQNIIPENVPQFDKSHFSEDIQINQNSKLESFVETWVGLNKKRRGFYGYRVKIYSEVGISARQNANALRLRCKSAYPDIIPYVKYNEPSFEVHLGDFRTRIEAMALLLRIRDKYPGAFIVREVIDFPKL